MTPLFDATAERQVVTFGLFTEIAKVGAPVTVATTGVGLAVLLAEMRPEK